MKIKKFDELYENTKTLYPNGMEDIIREKRTVFVGKKNWDFEGSIDVVIQQLKALQNSNTDSIYIICCEKEQYCSDNVIIEEYRYENEEEYELRVSTELEELKSHKSKKKR
jgi:hypothetical protein